MEKSEGAEHLTHHQIAISRAVGDLSSSAEISGRSIFRNQSMAPAILVPISSFWPRFWHLLISNLSREAAAYGAYDRWLRLAAQRVGIFQSFRVFLKQFIRQKRECNTYPDDMCQVWGEHCRGNPADYHVSFVLMHNLHIVEPQPSGVPGFPRCPLGHKPDFLAYYWHLN